MDRTITVAVLVAVGAASACATKRYPIAAQISAAERATMVCRELHLELIRAEKVRKQISARAKTDWR